jgi:hypothetical protein
MWKTSCSLESLAQEYEGRLVLHGEEIPHGLVKALNERRCMVCIGAGFSQNAGNPGFVTLLAQLLKIHCKVPPEQEHWTEDVSKYLSELEECDDAKTLLGFANACADKTVWTWSNIKLDEVQFALAKSMTPPAMVEAMQTLLCKAEKMEAQTKDGEVYIKQRQALLNLPFAVAATWNFDDLLDNAPKDHPTRLQNATLPRPEVDEERIRQVLEPAQPGGQRKIVKLNGDLGGENLEEQPSLEERQPSLGRQRSHDLKKNPSAGVVSKSAYEKYHKIRSNFFRVVLDEFKYSLLTIGLRLESDESPYDPLGLKWSEETSIARRKEDDEAPEHYFLMPSPQCEEEFLRLPALLKRYKVRILLFDPIPNDKKQWTGLGLLLQRIGDQCHRTVA